MFDFSKAVNRIPKSEWVFRVGTILFGFQNYTLIWKYYEECYIHNSSLWSLLFVDHCDSIRYLTPSSKSAGCSVRVLVIEGSFTLHNAGATSHTTPYRASAAIKTSAMHFASGSGVSDCSTCVRGNVSHTRVFLTRVKGSSKLVYKVFDQSSVLLGISLSFIIKKARREKLGKFELAVTPFAYRFDERTLTKGVQYGVIRGKSRRTYN